MNGTSATQQAAAHHILLVTLDYFGDLKTGCCPVAWMLELVQAAVRVLLIAAAGVALALAGIVVSVLAYFRELCASSARRKEGAKPAGRVVHSQRHPRDSCHSSPVRKPRSRYNMSMEPALAPIPASPVAGTTEPTLVSTPPRSPERESSPHRQERSLRSPRKQRKLGRPMSPESVVVSDRPPCLAPHRTQVPEAPLPPIRISSDSSDQHGSTDPSVVSISSGEHVESHPRGVLQRIRSQHNNLRDRCLVRAQSIPTPKAPLTPRRRTDPYQAPYYFPTPLSPDAGTYRQEVIKERHGKVPANPNPGEQVQFASLPSSPHRETHELPVSGPAISVPARSEGEVEETPIPRARRHRWSWHLPHLPERTRSVDSDRNSRRPEREHKDGLSKFKFGHSRRRSGVVDIRTTMAT